MELLVPGDGIVSQDTDRRELLLPGGSTLAEDQQLGGGGRSLFGLKWRGALAANRYIFHRATDEGDAPPPPVQPDTLAPHLVRVPFKAFKRNRYIWSGSVEGPEQLNDAGAGPLVVPTWDGFRLARASRYYYRHQAFTSAPVEPSTFARHFVVVPFKPLKRSRYLNHYAQDTSFTPPPPTFNPGWARNSNVVWNARRIDRGVTA